MFKKVAIAAAIAAMSVGAQAANGSGSITFESIVAGDLITQSGVTAAIAVTNTPTNSPNKNTFNKGASWDGWSFYTGTTGANSTTVAGATFTNLTAGTDTYLFGTSAVAGIIANTGLAGGTTMPAGTTAASWTAVQAAMGNWAMGIGGSKSLNIKSTLGTDTEFSSVYLYNTSTADKEAIVTVSGYINSGTGTQALVASQAFTLADETGGTFNLTNFAGKQVDGLSFSTSGGKFLIVDNIMAVTAVPEPSTYAMLLAGLGMMGVIARRRTRA